VKKIIIIIDFYENYFKTDKIEHNIVSN